MVSEKGSTHPFASTSSIRYTPGQSVFGVLTLVVAVNETGKTQPGPDGPDDQLMV